MRNKSVQIAGGGIAGLSVGALLARQGWAVTIHERGEAIREIGAGIYIKNNSLEVLERLGVLDRIRSSGTVLERAQIQFADGSVKQERVLKDNSRVITFPRQALIEGLRDAALEAGVRIVTGSQAIGAVPHVGLKIQDGTVHSADLVIAADGVNSAVRQSLNVGGGFTVLPTIINRYIIKGRTFTPQAKTVEHWSGNRRIGVTPSGPDSTYVYMVAPEWDVVAAKFPLDPEDWSNRFPTLRSLMTALAASPGTQYNYGLVECPTWCVDNVAVLGDAAHGLPPTLGQGAGLTLMNAYALAHVVGRADNVSVALKEWESRVRFISDQTQKWAVRYDWFTRQWPTALDFARPLAAWSFGRFKFLNDRMRVADHGLALAGIDMAQAVKS